VVRRSWDEPYELFTESVELLIMMKLPVHRMSRYLGMHLFIEGKLRSKG